MRQFNLRVLLLLGLGHLTVDLYQGALPAILPFLKENLSLTYTMTGVILIVSTFTSSLVQPLFGLVSDKKEKGFLLPAGAFIAGAGYSLLSVPSQFLPILFLVFVGGLGVSAYHPEGFKTAAFFTGQKPATGMSIFSVGGNLGFALGPIVATWLISSLGFYYLPVFVVPSLLFTAGILAARKTITLPSVEDRAARDGVDAAGKGSMASLVLLIAVVFMRSWMQMGIVSYIPFYFVSFLKGNPVYAAKLVGALLLGGTLGTLAGAPVGDRWGYLRLIRLSSLLCALIFPIIFWVQGNQVLFFVVLFALGMALSCTFSVTVVMAQKLLPRNTGIASGLMTGFAIGAGGIGVTLLGVVADHFSVYTALKSIAVLPVIAFILSTILRYRPERQVA
jgi:FSR family fosmidomycin resistance protein-like MFS transporter